LVSAGAFRRPPRIGAARGRLIQRLQLMCQRFGQKRRRVFKGAKDRLLAFRVFDELLAF
jgi:hypothetical protein